MRQIWSPQDSIDTAQAFALELHNAERGARYCVRCDKSQLVVHVDSDGVCRNCKRRSRVERFLFSRSRFRRARIMDGLAVSLLLILMAAFGCIAVMLSPQAKADVTDPQVIAFTAAFGGVVCSVLDDGHATPAGDPVYAEFAAALRGRPGEWGVWPVRSMNQGHVRSNVAAGRYVAMPRGEFQARVHGGRCLVRYIGGEAQ